MKPFFANKFAKILYLPNHAGMRSLKMGTYRIINERPPPATRTITIQTDGSFGWTISDPKTKKTFLAYYLLKINGIKPYYKILDDSSGYCY